MKDEKHNDEKCISISISSSVSNKNIIKIVHSSTSLQNVEMREKKIMFAHVNELFIA